ncbi:hypothetical protein [Paraburkholderia sp. J41]|uniref:hypothetical protein n=1 Tax=Paraburkholderia sp. J41 TaxID=2805433 RepID=UPI002AC33CFD|nr:hypothetical protein [Paraburkholderia sp. J41]
MAIKPHPTLHAFDANQWQRAAPYAERVKWRIGKILARRNDRLRPTPGRTREKPC